MSTTDEIFDYVMTNPYNTNPNQLKTMLDSVSGGSAVSICEANVDFNTGRIEFLEKASVLYEQKKSGTLIIHFKMTVSDTAYQDLYFDVFACNNSVNGSTSVYSFYVNFVDAGIVTLDASTGDNNPVGYINFDTDGK